jgi:hypothetical protein
MTAVLKVVAAPAFALRTARVAENDTRERLRQCHRLPANGSEIPVRTKNYVPPAQRALRHGTKPPIFTMRTDVPYVAALEEYEVKKLVLTQRNDAMVCRDLDRLNVVVEVAGPFKERPHLWNG